MAEVWDKSYGAQLNGPAMGGFIITPHDDNELAKFTRAIRCTGARTLRIVPVDGDTWDADFMAGETRPIRAKKILVAGTTGSGKIEGMY